MHLKDDSAVSVTCNTLYDDSLNDIYCTTYKLSNCTLGHSDDRLFILFSIYIAGFAIAIKCTQETQSV